MPQHIAAHSFRVDDLGDHFVNEVPVSAQEFEEARVEYDQARAAEPVRARYLGDTPVVFPHLGDEQGPVSKGDLVDVDRYSAEERTDLLCLHCEPEAVAQAPTRPELLARARELGLDVKGNAKKTDLEAALAAHEATQDDDDPSASGEGTGDESERE